MSYWNNNGKYSEKYRILYDRYVPKEGATSFIESENLRAISKIYYDYYNNGLCNNLSGPYKFLKENAPYIRQEFFNALDPYNLGDEELGVDIDTIEAELEAAADAVIENLIIAEDNNALRAFNGDMHLLQEEVSAPRNYRP